MATQSVISRCAGTWVVEASGSRPPLNSSWERVVEFEFVQVVDEAIRYCVRILFRENNRYGGYYVNDDGTDIRPAN